MTKPRRTKLTTLELARLEHACSVIAPAFGHPPYLVGSSNKRKSWRDVDVRLILPDEEFDHLFRSELNEAWSPSSEFPGGLWGIVCMSIAHYLSSVSGLPIDFQIQRQTEANAKYGGEPRNPMGHGFRQFAGGGDAT